MVLLNYPEKSVLAFSNLIIIHTKMVNRRQLIESKHPIRRFAKLYLFIVEVDAKLILLSA